MAQIGEPQAMAWQVGQRVLARPQHLARGTGHEPRD